MMNKLLRIITQGAIMIVVTGISLWPFTTHALTTPTLTIESVQTAVDKNAALIRFTVNDSSLFLGGTEIKVQYKRSNQPDFTLSQLQEVYQVYSEGNNAYHVVLQNLLPNTQYTYYIEVQDGVGPISQTDQQTFTTRSKKFIQISSVTPTTVKVGGTLTINGHGFGQSSAQVRLGYGGYNELTVISWSDTKIVARVGTNPTALVNSFTDGPVIVNAFPYPSTRYSGYALTDVGPKVDVVREGHLFAVDGCWPGVKADTYDAIQNFNTLYLQAYGRLPKCAELTFHLQHKTAHDRLQSWLAQQSEATWWKQLQHDHNNQVVYGANRQMYFVANGKLYALTDFMTAIAWGLNLDQAQYVSSLNDASHSGVLYYAQALSLWNGPYYQQMLQLSNGGTATFTDASFQQYVNANVALLRKGGEDSTAAVCSYVKCGVVY